jgi:hypothetical protein
MEEMPSSTSQVIQCTGSVTNLVLIPDEAGNANNAAVAALQQQIIAIVTDAGQQTPASTVGTIFQDMGQDINSTFTQAMTTLQQPMISDVSEPTLNPLTGNVESVPIGDGENSEATLAAFEAISVLADASNHKVHVDGQQEDCIKEKKVKN